MKTWRLGISQPMTNQEITCVFYEMIGTISDEQKSWLEQVVPTITGLLVQHDDDPVPSPTPL